MTKDQNIILKKEKQNPSSNTKDTFSKTKNLQDIIISHIDNNGTIQSNAEHQQGVAERTKLFAEEFGMGDCGFIMGLLHDKGKEQKEWQKKIHSRQIWK